MRIGLVSCVKTKASAPSPAQDLYRSTLFRYARAYAERHADEWFVLSAKHGLLRPLQVVEPYEQTLTGAKKAERIAWAHHVREQMEAGGLLQPDRNFLWLAGREYQDQLRALLAGHEHEDPLAGLGIGRRMSFLKRAMRIDG